MFLRNDDYVSNEDCETLRAMTRFKCESAVILFVIHMQILIICGAIHNLDFSGFHSPFFSFRTSQFYGHWTAFALRRR